MYRLWSDNMTVKGLLIYCPKVKREIGYFSCNIFCEFYEVFDFCKLLDKKTVDITGE